MTRIPLRITVITVALLAASFAAPAQGQDRGDTARVYGLDSVMVTAERVLAPLATSTAAISRVSGAELRRLPVRDLGDALRIVPGFSVVDVDGGDGDPRLTVRGFYGAGEAEYVTVLLDGRPLNAPHTGTADWNLVPLAAIQSVEVLRGGVSSLYGDAAIGGVVSISTRMRPGARHVQGMVGADGALRAAAAAAGSLPMPVQGWFNLSRTNGFRDHAERASHGAGLTAGLLDRPGASLAVTAVHRGREFQEPGPLTKPALARSRTQASPLHRFDRTGESLTLVSLDGSRGAGGARVSGYLSGEVRGTDVTRTIVLAPEFADTKRRDLDTRRLLGSVQVNAPGLRLVRDDRVTVGFDGSLGWMGSDYFALLAGGPDDYRVAAGGPGTPDESGDAARVAAAGFARYELQPLSWVRVSLGGRLDWLRDRWTPRAPTVGDAAAAEHAAFSPRIGVNVQYLRGADHEGWVYANAGRSFKAATPDQLFDRRTLPVPFEPYKITISNPELKPQHGVSYEAGLHYRAALARAGEGALSVAAYQVDMRDELDFDLQTFRYVNLGRSRHRGIEAALNFTAAGGWSGFTNYTLQEVESRFGANLGKALKAVPRHVLAGGVVAPLAHGAVASVTVTDVRGVWLDDANTLRLPGWTRVDARIAVPLRGVRLWIDAFNLLGREYSTTGFADSADPSVVYYFPSAGRTLQISLGTDR